MLMARCNRSELLAAMGRYREAIAGLERLVELEEALSDCRELRGGLFGLSTGVGPPRVWPVRPILGPGWKASPVRFWCCT